MLLIVEMILSFAIFAQSHPDIDINVITPKAEYIDRFLEWYQQ